MAKEENKGRIAVVIVLGLLLLILIGVVAAQVMAAQRCLS